MKEQNDFKPFISADKIMPEFTVTSVILGILLAVVFGGANAYLGLRVGMTISASIPAAVISMGIIRYVLKKDSILENNMVQTIGSAGESVAAGAIFTMPAIFIWMKDWGEQAPSLVEIALIALCGGILGVAFMIPLRRSLIVEEHGVIPYPEGTACAEVLMAGEKGGSQASTVFAGLGIAAAFKFITDGIQLFPSEVHYEITPYKGAGIGISALPSLAGVGFICGKKVSVSMFAGSLLSWVVLMPMISLFGGNAVLYPATKPISTMTSDVIWSNYIRYIGAGAIATAGIISLIKSLPLIVRTFGKAIKGMKSTGGSVSNLRTEQEMSPKAYISLIVIAILAIWLLPTIPVGLVGAIIIAVFGFFFATVSSRIVGLIGSSNNPVSGMTIATLIIASLILKATSGSSHASMVGAMCIGAVICVVAAIAGDMSQDLKTGYIVGATPKKQQYGEIIGVIASSLAIGGTLYLLNAAWGFGSTELPAPQAIIMKMVVEGIMSNHLPWNMIIVGVIIAVLAEVLGLPLMSFAVGMYLPIDTMSAICVGGLIRAYIEKKKLSSEDLRKDAISHGILYSSGLIAGEGIVGILLAIFAVINVGTDASGKAITLAKKISFTPFAQMPNVGNIISLIAFAALSYSLVKFMNRPIRESNKA